MQFAVGQIELDPLLVGFTNASLLPGHGEGEDTCVSIDFTVLNERHYCEGKERQQVMRLPTVTECSSGASGHLFCCYAAQIHISNGVSDTVVQ